MSTNAVEFGNQYTADVAGLLRNMKQKNEELTDIMEKVSISSVDSTERLGEYMSQKLAEFHSSSGETGGEPTPKEFQDLIQSKVVEMMEEQLKSETEMASAFEELERNARKIKITLNDRLGQEGDTTCKVLMDQVNAYHASVSVAVKNWKRVPTLTAGLIKNLTTPSEHCTGSIEEVMNRMKDNLLKHHEILRRVTGQSGVVMPSCREPALPEDVQAAGWRKMDGK